MLTLKAIDLVVKERVKQDEKWGLQRHDMRDWFIILMEEVGEFSQTLQKGDVQSKESDADNKIEELTQVTAVALAMLEQLIEEEKGNVK